MVLQLKRTKMLFRSITRVLSLRRGSRALGTLVKMNGREEKSICY